MTPPRVAREARRARAEEAQRRVAPSVGALSLVAATVLVGAFTLVSVAIRLGALFDGRPGAAALVVGSGVALALSLVAAPIAAYRRRAREVRARERRVDPTCPRCGAECRARCDACGARVLEAEGLRITYASDAWVRRQRWRAAARGTRRARPSWAFSSVIGTAYTIGGLGALWGVAALLGGAPPSAVEAPLALDRQVPLHGTALARDLGLELPAGPTTRPRAPVWTGTQVLARRSGPHHELAFVVRAERARAFVVYASGASGWVRASDLLAPELATGDALELGDGVRYVPVTLVERIGTALRVRSADGTARWTSASRVRVRSDARHARGEGLESDVPPDAWVELRAGGVLVPGLIVGREGDRAQVVVADGSVRSVARSEVRAQRIGPGVEVWVDGRRAPVIVAARVGDAVAVVDADGRRSWTALSRVRREAP